MDKGIRPYVDNKFVELNEQRRRGEITNTAFRKSVMADAMEQFSITLASAATHYNHAFKTIKEANAELVSGLGRADDKKGGRKPKAAVVAELVGPVQTTVSEGVVENTSTQTVDVNPDAEEVAPPDTNLYTVKKKDGTVVAEGLSIDAANALVAKAAAQKKGKLIIA